MCVVCIDPSHDSLLIADRVRNLSISITCRPLPPIAYPASLSSSRLQVLSSTFPPPCPREYSRVSAQCVPVPHASQHVFHPNRHEGHHASPARNLRACETYLTVDGRETRDATSKLQQARDPIPCACRPTASGSIALSRKRFRTDRGLRIDSKFRSIKSHKHSLDRGAETPSRPYQHVRFQRLKPAACAVSSEPEPRAQNPEPLRIHHAAALWSALIPRDKNQLRTKD